MEIGKQMAVSALKRLPGRTFIEINKKRRLQAPDQVRSKGRDQRRQGDPVAGRSCRWWRGRGMD